MDFFLISVGWPSPPSVQVSLLGHSLLTDWLQTIEYCNVGQQELGPAVISIVYYSGQ